MIEPAFETIIFLQAGVEFPGYTDSKYYRPFESASSLAQDKVGKAQRSANTETQRFLCLMSTSNKMAGSPYSSKPQS